MPPHPPLAVAVCRCSGPVGGRCQGAEEDGGGGKQQRGAVVLLPQRVGQRRTRRPSSPSCHRRHPCLPRSGSSSLFPSMAAPGSSSLFPSMAAPGSGLGRRREAVAAPAGAPHRNLRLLLRDAAEDDEAVAASALKCLGFALYHPVLVSTISGQLAQSVLATLVRLIMTTKMKAICNLAVWCISVQQ